MLSTTSSVFFLALCVGPLAFIFLLMLFFSPKSTQGRSPKTMQPEPYVFIEKYSKQHGFHREVMEELIKFLETKQIEARYFAIDTHNYELFVDREKVLTAKTFVKRFREKKKHAIEESRAL